MSFHSNLKNKNLQLFATAPKGLELLLVDELKQLGAVNAAEKLAGVTFNGDLALAYRACLWSRLANRILLTLTKMPAETPEALYAGVQTIAWDQHLSPDATLAVHFVSVQSNITHTLFGAQKVKDAIVDQLRAKYGARPSVSREQPDVSVSVYLYRNEATISLDLSGESLHKRGYRLMQVTAPLKENLAAALLYRANWPAIAKAGGALMDPMCGSGTLLIEAAMMAAKRAPALKRSYFGFLKWKQHDAELWQRLLHEANKAEDLSALPPIVGYDRDPEAIKAAFSNIERAGFLGVIHVEKRDLQIFAPKSNAMPGLVIVNPPYGERLEEMQALQPTYTLLGDKLKTAFEGWQAAVFTGNPDLGKQMGLRSIKQYALYNGAIPCKLLLFNIESTYFIDRRPEANNERLIRAAKRHVSPKEAQAVQMFSNRLQKNLKHKQRQVKREGLTTYRIYDADLPEYAFAIDILEDRVIVQEYPAPKSIDPEKVLQRRQAVLSVLPDILAVPAAQIFFSILPKEKG